MINTLVVHKKKNLGIGCIAKELKNTYKVNFGLDDVLTCKKDAVAPIGLDGCKTITFDEFKNRVFYTDSTLNDVIVGNELKHYVGIGWITTRVVTFDDLKNYPRVIQ